MLSDCVQIWYVCVISFHFISFHFISFHFISFHLPRFFSPPHAVFVSDSYSACAAQRSFTGAGADNHEDPCNNRRP